MNYLYGFGELPWIALGLAGTFSVYGVLRKVADVGPLIGLTMETLILVPAALLLFGLWTYDGSSHFGTLSEMDLYFLGCGLITSFPLLCFAAAVKRLRYSTLGLFQYLAPTFQFLLGVFVYNEPFSLTHGGYIYPDLDGPADIHRQQSYQKTGELIRFRLSVVTMSYETVFDMPNS
ncbi:MAG: EamA family transporter [bacterium]